MVKSQALKKKLIKTSIIMLVAVSASAAIAYSVFAWSSSLQEDARKAENKLNAARRDVSSREIKNADARKYLELYKRITGESEQAKISDLSREKAQLWLKELARQTGVVNLQGSFSPVTPMKDENFRKKTLEGISSEVKLEFSAMTDENAYRFLNAVLHRFPGYVKVTAFTLTRDGEISDSVLVATGRGEIPALVKGSMDFYWIGVREIEVDEEAEADSNAGNMLQEGF